MENPADTKVQLALPLQVTLVERLEQYGELLPPAALKPEGHLWPANRPLLQLRARPVGALELPSGSAESLVLVVAKDAADVHRLAQRTAISDSLVTALVPADLEVSVPVLGVAERRFQLVRCKPGNEGRDAAHRTIWTQVHQALFREAQRQALIKLDPRLRILADRAPEVQVWRPPDPIVTSEAVFVLRSMVSALGLGSQREKREQLIGTNREMRAQREAELEAALEVLRLAVPVGVEIGLADASSPGAKRLVEQLGLSTLADQLPVRAAPPGLPTALHAALSETSREVEVELLLDLASTEITLSASRRSLRLAREKLSLTRAPDPEQLARLREVVVLARAATEALALAGLLARCAMELAPTPQVAPDRSERVAEASRRAHAHAERYASGSDERRARLLVKGQ